MPAKTYNSGVSSLLSNLFNRKREERRNRKTLASRGRRNLQMEGLEKREMFAIGAIFWNSAGAIVIQSTDTPTSATVSAVGSNYRVTDNLTNKTFDFAISNIKSVDFVGGAAGDRFVNNVGSLPSRAWGNGGNDYLEGYGATDTFMGGEGNDTLLGYGGIDHLWGGNGDDVIKGGSARDFIYGEGGNDYLNGEDGDDHMVGGDNADTLLGGTGADTMWGGGGDDQLNGQDGFDTLNGEGGNDVLVSIDGGGDILNGGDHTDTLWINSSDDATSSLRTTDVVHTVFGFANGADLTLNGDNIADPTDIGAKVRFDNTVVAGLTRGTNPLLSSIGAASSDAKQGGVGDPWLIAGLSAIASQADRQVWHHVVDFNDGTYGVKLDNNFYRVDNELPVFNAANGARPTNLRNAGLGFQDSLWVAIVEKAYAHHKTGANTYASLNGGSSLDVFNAFRMSSGSKSVSSYASASALGADMLAKWNSGNAMVIGSVPVKGGGTTALSVAWFVTDASGKVTHVTLRNPSGIDSLDRFSVFPSATGGVNSQDGLFTVSISNLFSCGGTLRFGRV